MTGTVSPLEPATSSWPPVVVRTWRESDGQWWREFSDDRQEPFEPAVEFAPPVTVQPPTGPLDVAADYPVLDWPSLWIKAETPVEWLVEPLLIAGRVIALFSPAKAGKSLLALDIGAALATGRPALGNAARDPMPVVYVDCENSVEDIVERLSDLGYGPDDDLSNLRYLSFPNLPALDSPKGGAHLLAIAEHHCAAVVVIDTVSRVIDGPENDGDTFRALYRHAIMPLKAAGRAVVRLDHSGKDLTRGQRGSSAKVDDVDAVWQLTARPGGAIDLRRTHTRNNHGVDYVQLVRLTGPLRHVCGAGGKDADVEEVIAQLDRLGVPTTTGRDKCRDALLEAGMRRGNDLLSVAVRERKRRADLSGTGAPPGAAPETLPIPQDSPQETW